MSALDDCIPAVRVSSPLRQQIDDICNRSGESVSEFVRAALRSHAQRQQQALTSNPATPPRKPIECLRPPGA